MRCGPSLPAYMNTTCVRSIAVVADNYLKGLQSERKSLWATCRLKGLARNTPERLRIAELDEAIAAHLARDKTAPRGGSTD